MAKTIKNLTEAFKNNVIEVNFIDLGVGGKNDEYNLKPDAVCIANVRIKGLTIKCTDKPTSWDNWHMSLKQVKSDSAYKYYLDASSQIFSSIYGVNTKKPIITNTVGLPIYKILKIKNTSSDVLASYFIATKYSHAGRTFTLWISADDVTEYIYNDSSDKINNSTTPLPGPTNENTKTPDDLKLDGGGTKSKKADYDELIYNDDVKNGKLNDAEEYWNELYTGYWNFTMQSFKSVIGLPFHFMGNVDPPVGSSVYGKQFIEDILYDMPLVMLRPGGPVMNATIGGEGGVSENDHGLVASIKKAVAIYDGYFKGETLKTALFGDTEEGKSGVLQQIFVSLFVGKYARFYTFSQDMEKYVEYVNTLCHLFIHFLGIGDVKYRNGWGEEVKYAHYNDTWELCELDGGKTLKDMFGPNRCIYGYFEPESQLSRTFSNTTKRSALADTIEAGSDMSKEYAFFAGAAGVEKGAFDSVAGYLSQLNGSALLGRLFGNVAEGIGTVIAGNHLDLPEIYDDSTSDGTYNLVFKLVSPYGDPESIFLYVLRPLARLMAMSLPKQFGPNSYASPFLVQAFAKGQFNIQCGIVTELSVRRCGNGGESYTVTNIPTELEVSMTIKDMYELVTLSNEYLGSRKNNKIWDPLMNAFNAVNPFGTAKAARLLFNNIGLLDFCASYCGFNLNSPELDTVLVMLQDMWINRVSDQLELPSLLGVQKWRSPKWNRELSDAYYSAVFKAASLISG